MGDYVGVQLPVTEIYLGLTNHPSQLSLATSLWVGKISIGNVWNEILSGFPLNFVVKLYIYAEAKKNQ